MGDCHLPCYNYNKSDEKSCRYAYSTWCPTCERSSPRRRAQGEVEICKKKCKDMKGAVPRRFMRTHEYENIVLEGKMRGPEGRDRIRANLCELPTSYISNNCQQNVAKLSSDKSNLVDCLEKSVRTYEQTLKFVDCNNFAMNKQKAKPIPKSKSQETKNSTPKKYKLINRKDIFGHDFDSYKSSLISDPQKKSFVQNGLKTSCIDYDTGTYFDKVAEARSLHERYTKEVQYLRERLGVMQQSQGGVMAPRVESKQDGDRQRSAPVRKVKPKPVPKIKNKCVSAKVAKTKLNIGTSVPHFDPTTPLLESNVSQAYDAGSDCTIGGCSDESDNDLAGDDDSDALDESIENHLEQTLKAISVGDTLQWPIRHSLFPNIPPYIRFNSFDADVPVKIPAGRKYFKWKLSTITPIVVRKTLHNSGFALVRKSNTWLGTWGKHMRSPMFKTLKENQKLNHFPGTFQLGRKDRLWRNYYRLMKKHGYKEFNFLPQTFVLPQDLKIFRQAWDFKTEGGSNMWIVKPPASARGIGIKVINRWSQLQTDTPIIVQKYISDPYLINGSKFDLRLYVLVTSFNPLRIYLYPDGLARFASEKYSSDPKDVNQKFVHLTNYSINKLSSQYAVNEDADACQGHKWTLMKLLEYLEGQGINRDVLWRNMKELVVKTIITGDSTITQLCEENMNTLYNCYELFGVDVLLDENLKPWLLEVNISPSLHSTSPLDAHVKGPMVTSVFDLAQFHFPVRLKQGIPGSPACYEPKLYTTGLTKKEREKHELFEQYKRIEYLDYILKDLTGDDVRKLTQAEDEFIVKGQFERIFPTAETYNYLEFMEDRYYNKLFDAWETKYEKNREDGIKVLRRLCAKNVHLKTAPQTVVHKSSQSTIPGGASLQPSTNGQSQQQVEIPNELAKKAENYETRK